MVASVIIRKGDAMKFKVPDMSCGHCTSTIEKSIKAADGAASVSCDLASRTISVESRLSPAGIADILKSAGYDSSNLPS